jgi:hypothetical protein
MSSYEGMDTTDTGIDLWRVQLGSGEIRVMSLDALDDAFQAGTIDEGTPVLPPGAVTWTKLGDAAGLEAPEAHAASVSSLAPIALSLESNATGPATRYAPLADASLAGLDRLDRLDDLEHAAFKPKKGRVLAGIGLAVMLAGGLGFAATRVNVGPVAAASELRAAKAAAAAPPPEAVDLNAATQGKVLTEAQKQKLADADKAREAAAAQKRKDRPAPPAKRGPRDKSAPFVNGGSKFDPLNGAL